MDETRSCFFFLKSTEELQHDANNCRRTIASAVIVGLILCVGLHITFSPQEVKNNDNFDGFTSTNKTPQIDGTCRSLVETYHTIQNETDRNAARGAPLMMKTLEVAANGCGRYIGYQWHQRPSILKTWRKKKNHRNMGAEGEQLVHFYATNISSMDVSFVISGALALKKDWRRFRILLWLPPPTFQEYQNQGLPLLFPECPHHVTVLEYNMTAEAKGTAVEERVQRLPGRVSTDPRFTTDAVRYILLFKYGGMWVDIDALFVKDYDNLFQLQFPGYTYNGKGRLNGAMMHFFQGTRAIQAMIEEAAATDTYGPYDGFRGMTQKFWEQYNEKMAKSSKLKVSGLPFVKRSSHAKDKVQIFPTDMFEIVPEGTGLRKSCNFFDNIDEIYREPGAGVRPWYQDHDFFGVEDATHVIVHTHNECKEQSKWKEQENPKSAFRVLLHLYHQSIKHYPYCGVGGFSG